jgi:hypothetical protein
VLAGKIDQGNRSAVTGGKQMDGFILTLTNFLLAARSTISTLLLRRRSSSTRFGSNTSPSLYPGIITTIKLIRSLLLQSITVLASPLPSETVHERFPFTFLKLHKVNFLRIIKR